MWNIVYAPEMRRNEDYYGMEDDMRLSAEEIKDRVKFEEAGIHVPLFDREAMIKRTKDEPVWLHFGAGNIFRAFPAAVQQKLIEQGVEDKGIIVAEGYDYEIIDMMDIPHDGLTLAVTLKSDGTIDKTVIGSIAEVLKADSSNVKDFNRLKEIFRAPSLQMVSFTITEKGYSLVRGDGSFMPDVLKDFEAGPAKPVSYIGKLASLCYERYMNGELPVALVSMDNCSHNGDKLYSAVSTFAIKWTENGVAEEGFRSYIEDSSKVSFPWSMIDKITPRPDAEVKQMLISSGFETVDSVITSKNTYVAPFVNAEETQYLVIEDAFPNGRPRLEEGGIIFTDRETVDRVEKMKVCTCLNPLHTALAVYGCLLGYTKISDELHDMDLVRLIKRIGYVEGLPVVVNPGILDPKEFIDTVVEVRLPNPFMPDTPQRIATDTSQKLPIRFGETVKAYMADEALSVDSLVAIPVVYAGWCRYLLGTDDNGDEFSVSPDPRYEGLAAGLQPVREYLKMLCKGEEAAGKLTSERIHDILKPILEDKGIFAVNLYEAGLGERVEKLFAELIQGRGAVRAVLEKLHDTSW